MATLGGTGPGRADDGSLQAAAIGGDGHAFAELYDRHEQRVYGFCLRVLASPDDAADATQETFVRMLQRLPKLEGRELNFVAYVLTTARHVCYDMIGSRRTIEPVAEAPEPPISTPGSLEEDPERAALLGATREQVEVAVAALPARQREVLALREVECLSYDEIAEIMEIRENAVAQLISRARIKLREVLRGSALASIEAASPDCDRALPLIAMRQDGQHSSELDWLRSHLAACATCRTREAAMQEAGVSYRILIPVVVVIWLRHATIARAAEYLRVDWSEVAAAGAGSDAGAGAGAGGAGAGGAGAAGAGAAGAAGAGAAGAAGAGAARADAIAPGGARPGTNGPRGRLRRMITGRRPEAALAITAFLAVLLLLTGSLGDRLFVGSLRASATTPSPPAQFAAPVQIRERHPARHPPPRRRAATGPGIRHAGATTVTHPSTAVPVAADRGGARTHRTRTTHRARGVATSTSTAPTTRPSIAPATTPSTTTTTIPKITAATTPTNPSTTPATTPATSPRTTPATSPGTTTTSRPTTTTPAATTPTATTPTTSTTTPTTATTTTPTTAAATTPTATTPTTTTPTTATTTTPTTATTTTPTTGTTTTTPRCTPFTPAC